MKMELKPTLCKCGCGKMTSGKIDRGRYPEYIAGHYWKGKKPKSGFPKGYTPWNKGKVGYTNSGSFKNGELATNWNGFKKGQDTWNKGIHYILPVHFKKGERPSPKTEFKKGKLHPNWEGGKTLKNHGFRRTWDYALWARTVKKRDGFKCVQCGSTTNLHADHIIPICLDWEKRLDLSNGRTLCSECHRKTPTWGGKMIKIKRKYANSLHQLS